MNKLGTINPISQTSVTEIDKYGVLKFSDRLTLNSFAEPIAIVVYP